LFGDWNPDAGDFAHFVQVRLTEAYRDDPQLPIGVLLRDALLVNAAIHCDEPERVIALFAEEAQHRAWHEDDEDDPAEPLRWADEWRRIFAAKGWVASALPDPNGWGERDIAFDRCRACGKLRREGRVEDRRLAGERLDDPCIRDLPGVQFACCGHGYSGRSVYVNDLHGPEAARRMRELGGDPPPQAFVLDSIDGDGPTS
jgi:hypothetical protein